MTPGEPANATAPAIARATRLREHFLGWQCRLRQMSARQAEGRPSAGMRPRALDGTGAELAPALTVLLVPSQPAPAAERFRHMMRRTNDPAQRRENALELLAATYYQRPGDFTDRLTALFGPGSALAGRLLGAGACRLEFEQYSQRYRLPCAVSELARDDAARQATYWHNSLFNPGLPGDVRVLAFTPDWARAEADPPVA